MMEGFCLAMKSLYQADAMNYRIQYFEYQISQMQHALQNPTPSTPVQLSNHLRLLTVG